MSDRELRQLLHDVIDEIDAGRVVPWRGRRLRNLVAGTALAAGLALAGCNESVAVYGAPATDAYGVPVMDARPEAGPGPVDAYGIPMVDAGLDAAPAADAKVDAGPQEDYGAPDVDGGSLDDGGVFLYGAPPTPKDEE
jgi:hypothetical protein